MTYQERIQLTLLSSAEREQYEERAAIVTHMGGMDEEAAQVFALHRILTQRKRPQQQSLFAKQEAA